MNEMTKTDTQILKTTIHLFWWWRWTDSIG